MTESVPDIIPGPVHHVSGFDTGTLDVATAHPPSPPPNLLALASRIVASDRYSVEWSVISVSTLDSAGVPFGTPAHETCRLVDCHLLLPALLEFADQTPRPQVPLVEQEEDYYHQDLLERDLMHTYKSDPDDGGFEAWRAQSLDWRQEHCRRLVELRDQKDWSLEDRVRRWRRFDPGYQVIRTILMAGRRRRDGGVGRGCGS